MRVPDKISVHIDFGGSEKLVGQIIRQEKKYFFKYDKNYLQWGYNLSPVKLKFDNIIQNTDTQIFEGLFGVFSDSQPDGWGRLLMDRYLMNIGWDISNIDPLLRLSLVGNNGIGALNYKPVFKDSFDDLVFSDIEHMYQQSMSMYQDKEADLETLYRLGGSSGGARPKIWINYNKNSNSYSYPLKIGYEPWIVKFPSQYDIEDIAAVEYVYYQMARKAGVNISESRLFETEAGNRFYGTKRFDVQENSRLHMISVAGLLHDNYRLSNIDYGHIIDASFQLTKSMQCAEDILRLAVFNVLANNKDDHSKNFSFLMDERGSWSFAPAYDLTYSTSSHGYQSTSVSGESKSIKYSHFNNLATHFGIKKLKLIVVQVVEALVTFKELSLLIGMKDRTLNQISKTLSTNIDLFGH